MKEDSRAPLLKRLEALGGWAEATRHEEIRKLRGDMRVRGMTMALLDEITAHVADHERPVRKGKPPKPGKPLAELARRATTDVTQDELIFDPAKFVDQVMAIATTEWDLDKEEARSLRVMINRILREKRKKIDTAERATAELARQFHRGRRSSWEDDT